MKHSVAAVIIASVVILATDLRAQESGVCELFHHLEKSDGHQLTLTGDLILAKNIAVLGAADCDYRYAPEGFRYTAAIALHPSAAVLSAQLEQLQHAAAELIVESIRDLELTPRPDTPIDPHPVNPEPHCVPPSRAELCAKADTLARAAQRDCADKVRELLAAHGIDSKNGSESEALTTAIRAGNKDIVEILLEAGAPLNPTRTALWPPLSDAAFTKHFDIMKLLLQSGAKVDAPDHHGDTLLVSTGFFDPMVTTILLEAGANPNATDGEGQTPLMKASARASNSR